MGCYYFPQDVLIDILSWLPVEPLLRFKCVSKSWFALLHSKEFISRHIVNQPLQHITLMYSNGNNVMSLLLDEQHYASSSCLMDFNHLDLTCPFPDGDYWMLDFYGHCDGLVLLGDAEWGIMVCNPATTETRHLPKSTTLDQYISQNSLFSQVGGIGFGYDYKYKEYKVVRITCLYTDQFYSIQFPSRVEVFSLGSGVDSTWRELTNTTIPIEDTLGVNKNIDDYLDGVYYWIAYDEQPQMKLYCFHMTDEVFQTVSTPDGYMEWEPKLGIYNKKSMSLFYFPERECQWKGVHVWVMKEFGVKESWTRQLIIGPFMGLGQPLAFWKKYQFLGEDNAFDLVTYNLSTPFECKKLPNDHKERPRFWQASSYKKTLLSVYGNNMRNTIQ